MKACFCRINTTHEADSLQHFLHFKLGKWLFPSFFTMRMFFSTQSYAFSSTIKICNTAATFLEMIKSKNLNVLQYHLKKLWLNPFLHPFLWHHYPDVITNVVATFTGPRNVQCENQEQKLPHHNVALLWSSVSPHHHFCRTSPERDLFVGYTEFCKYEKCGPKQQLVDILGYTSFLTNT